MKMKKVMIALAAVAFAMSAQAVEFKWSTTTAVFLPGSSSETVAGTAYLIDAATFSQAELVALMQGGGDFATAMDSYAIKSATMTAGKITATTWSDPVKADGTTAYAGGDSVGLYMTVLNGDNVYVSATSTKTVGGTGTTSYSFLNSASKNAASTGSYSAAGWYAAVPEPTSGLLMLVGLGALALRRRRA